MILLIKFKQELSINDVVDWQLEEICFYKVIMIEINNLTNFKGQSNIFQKSIPDLLAHLKTEYEFKKLVVY